MSEICGHLSRRKQQLISGTGEHSMSGIKLKPCPFCGSEAEIRSLDKSIFNPPDPEELIFFGGYNRAILRDA